MKQTYFIALFFIFSIQIISIKAYAQTSVPGGLVYGTWNLLGSPYNVQGSIQIPNDSTLTIEPGVKVIFQGSYKLNVQGCLRAIGSLTDSISFLPADSVVGWKGIVFDHTPMTNDSSKIFYSKLQYVINGINGGGAFYFDSFSKAIISNCRISDCYALGGGGGIYCGLQSNITITNNIITNNIALYHGGGICLMSCDPIIINNVITNNGASGGGNPAGGGIYFSQSNAVFLNNTVTNNSSVEGGGLHFYLSSPVLKNNIIYGNTTTDSGSQVFLKSEDSDPDFYYCEIQGGPAAFGLNGNIYTGVYQNNINADPLFVAPSGGSGAGFSGISADWSLQSSSPCVDMGDPSITTTGADYSGNPRVVVCRVDIGAYEYQSGPPFLVSVIQTETIPCFNNATGELQVNVSGGSLPYSYLWSNNATTENISNLVAGVYSVTVSETDGCTRTKTFTITQPSELTLYTSAIDIGCSEVCNGSSSAIVNGGTLPYSYVWSSGEITYQTNDSLCGGMHYVTVTDAHGCLKTDTIIILNQGAITITTQPLSFNKCINSEVTFSCNASSLSLINYIWKKNGTLITGATSETYTVYGLDISDEGIYTCEATNYCRSVSSDNAELKVIALDVDAGTDFTFCNDTVTHLTANAITNHITESGILNYNWSPTTDLGSPTSAITSAQPLINTTYSVTVTDQIGCSNTDAISLTSNTPVNITTQPLSYNKCLNSDVTFTLDVSGTSPISYVWKKNGNIITGATSEVYGIYGLGLSDEGIFTCEASNYCRTLVSDNAELKVIDISANAGIDSTICNGANIQLLATASTNHIAESGILSYNWTPATGLDNSNVSTPNANPAITTVYNVNVTDQLGCSDNDQVNVVVGNVFQDEEICIVTVDTTTWKNKIMWEKSHDMGTLGYNVYKEVSTNIYSVLGYVPYTDPAIYIDYSSTPESFSNRYKITVIDTCGAESAKSFFHKTVNLTIAAFGSTMGLNWNDYIDESGTYVPANYFIYRGTSPSNMTLLDSVPGGTNSYNDNNVYSIYYYIIGVKKPGGCNTAKSDFVSYSNKKDNATLVNIAGNKLQSGTILISPNPMTNFATLTIPNFSNQFSVISNQLTITDITGKVVSVISSEEMDNLQINSSLNLQIRIERGNLKPGIYFVELRSDRTYRGKLVVE